MVKFAHPGLFWLFLLFAGIIVLLIVYRIRRKNDLRLLAGDDLSNKLLDDFSPTMRRIKENLLIWGLLFLVIAAIGPKVGKKLAEIKRRGIDVIIALDTSVSMRAEDIKPSRLERAKYEAGKFIEGLQGDRIGVVMFAGTAYLQCPLTLDYSAAKLFLDAIDTGVIGTQGTAIADAIQTAAKALDSKDKKHKAVILISDGEDHEGEIESVIEQAEEEGIVIYAIGVGTSTGAPIPVPSTDGMGMEFKKDRSGRIVTTAMDETVLRQIANATDGKFYSLNQTTDAFGKIYKEILQMDKKDLRSHEYSDYQERYQIFLAIGLLLLIAEIVLPEKIKRKAEEE